MANGPEAREPDFEALYRELGMPAGGSLETLKQRYRRRVAQWHPDRGPDAARAEERLKALNLRYSAALEYHRRHGRLPGAPRIGVPAAEAFAVPIPEARPPDAVSTRGGKRLSWLLLALAAGAAWLLWPERDAPAPAVQEALRLDASPAEPDRELRRGLDRAAVLRLLGEPIMRDERAELWSYGPSWVQFECGRVAGWYSSPLLGLDADGVRPGERVGLGPGEPRRPCGPELPLAGGF